MAKPLVMPQVGQDIETAVIVEWLVKENDYVNKGDVFVVVESEKATLEVEAEESGVVLNLLYKEGDEAKVLEPIAYLGKSGEKLEDLKEPVTAETEEAPREKAPEIEEAVQTGEPRVLAAPAARRAARELGVDLAAIKGSGPGGRIVKQDVLAASSSAEKEIPFSPMRKKIAERLTRSKQTIPHFYLFSEVDMTEVLARRAAYNKEAQTKISVNDLIIKAVAAAICEFPGMNAHVADDRLTIRKNINIGVAVSTDEGLLVPVIPEAEQKSIQEISLLARENAECARSGVLKARSPGTFTISNLGMHSIDCFIPIINPPECAILGAGSIAKRAVPDDGGSIGVREMMTLTLACDHRAVDGAYASRFLNSIRKNLEDFTL
ncbi:MAG: dihydrolipoamide acetyltransferase family protein [Gemmatimonadota bacterium]|nr:dihydrolipoamide acetyltransferase family protein [Gemmatimonadota bacterium]